MSVTEAQRHRLYQSLRTALGDENADTFMNLTPPTDWSGVATNERVDAGFARVDARFEAIEARFEAVDARLGLIEQRLEAHDARFDRLEARFDRLEARFDGLQHDVASIRPELQRTLGTWIFASQAAVVSIIAVLLAVMR